MKREPVLPCGTLKQTVSEQKWGQAGMYRVSIMSPLLLSINTEEHVVRIRESCLRVNLDAMAFVR